MHHLLEYLAIMVQQRCVNPFFHRIDLQPNSYIAVSERKKGERFFTV